MRTQEPTQPTTHRHGQPRSQHVRSVVARKRREHSQLRANINFDGFLAVLRTEGISLWWQEIRPGVLGRTMGYMGRAVIVLNPCLEGYELLRVALHELGHVHLHLFDPAQSARGAGADPRAESEADLFANLLLS